MKIEKTIQPQTQIEQHSGNYRNQDDTGKNRLHTLNQNDFNLTLSGP